jgi:hypothetical protein
MHTPELIKSRTIKWLKGMLLQTDRLLDQDPADPNYNGGGCDAHFFAIALANALYWIKKTDLDTVAYAAELRRFSSELADGKDLRDMLEHDGDYIIGRGNKQGEYEIETHVNNGSLHIQGLAPFTLIHTNEGVSLGGRVSINLARELAKELLPKIISAPSAV